MCEKKKTGGSFLRLVDVADVASSIYVNLLTSYISTKVT